ncbi:MAG: hypothetical protein ACHP9V_07050 [Terriglobales bacterium]
MPDNSVHIPFGLVYSFFTNHPAFPFWTPKWLAFYTQLSPFPTCMELHGAVLNHEKAALYHVDF